MPTRFRLRELLAARHLSQLEVQALTGLAYSTINEMCNNRTHRIDLATLDVLCDALECQVGDIIERLPEKRTGPR
jgi:putative transcriptional regulator